MIFSVSRINKYIKSVFDKDYILNDIYVTGEISNFKYHSSGHIYFTLKDDSSQINCVMFEKYAVGLEFLPENGMNVTVYGCISVYEKTGQYQLYVWNMVKTGIGLLYDNFEKLKKRLEKEGIFNEEHKKKIPEFPKCIAVVTSPTGAAVQDIIRIVSRRNKNVKITVVPALVQGEGAAEDIADKIQLADKWGKADVIIVGRGGGSIEDLWAFNEEIVARAIYEAKTPVISAVGHETDFTIADFTADLRASTPSAAAELAVPEMTDIGETVAYMKKRLENAVNTKIERYRKDFNILNNNYSFLHFPEKVKKLKEQNENIKKRMEKNAVNKITNIKYKFDKLNEKPVFYILENNIKNMKLSINTNKCKLLKEMNVLIENNKKEYMFLLRGLENVSPMKVLERGFSIAENEYGKLIKSTDDAEIGDNIKIRLSDGLLNAEVTAKEKNNG